MAEGLFLRRPFHFVFAVENTGVYALLHMVETTGSTTLKSSTCVDFKQHPICHSCRRDELARLLTSRAETLDIDLGGAGGATPLHLAAAGGFEKCATNLLENSASPLVKNDKGQVRKGLPWCWYESCSKLSAESILTFVDSLMLVVRMPQHKTQQRTTTTATTATTTFIITITTTTKTTS